MENYAVYTTIGLAIIVIILFVWLMKLNKKLRKLTAGKEASSLEAIIQENNKMVHDLKSKQKDHHTHIVDIRKDLASTLQSANVIRFDALKEMGGMQSFAIALLDSHKNGVVISSMYTRDRMNVFAKEIIKGTSKHTLTHEEESAINKA